MRAIGSLVWLLLLPLLLLGCARGAVSASAAKEERWLEVVTPHFVLSTNQYEAGALDTARALEEVRAALLQLAWTGARNPPRGRVDVVVFRSPGEFNRYCGMQQAIAGVAFRRPGERQLMSFHPGRENGIPSVIVHELAHVLSDWFMPIQPHWFAEGLASYLETTTYDRGQRSGNMGELSKDRVDWLRGTRFLLSSEQLFSTLDPIRDDPRQTSAFYASSWLLVHYLINQDGDRFGKFQQRLARLESWRHAWEQEFAGVTSQQLDQQLVRYAATGQFRTVSAPIQVEAFEPQLRALSEAEQHGVLAQMASINQPELARNEMLEALRLDSNELNALRVRFHALAPEAARERLETARQAVAAHADRADAWWLLAQGGRSPSELEHALAQAQRLEPEHPGVALTLALDRLRRGHVRAALTLSWLALRRSGPSYEAVAAHLMALAAQQDCDAALRLQGSLEGLMREACGGARAGACTETSPQRLEQLMASCQGAHVATNSSTAFPQAPQVDPRTCIDSKSAAGFEAGGNGVGRLAPELIRSVVRSHYEEFRKCYESGLSRNPLLKGRVTVRFIIQPDGKVSRAVVADTDLPDCAVTACLRAGFTRLEFPAPEGGSVTVSYPILFEPG